MGCCQSTQKEVKKNEFQIKFSLSYLRILPPEYNKGQVFDIYVQVLVDNKSILSQENRLYAKSINPFDYHGKISQLNDINLDFEHTIGIDPKQKNQILTFDIELHLKNQETTEKKHEYKIDSKQNIVNFLNSSEDKISHEFNFTYEKSLQGQLSFSIFKCQSKQQIYKHQDKYHEEVVIEKFTDLFRKKKGWIYKNFPHLKQIQRNIRVISVIGMFSKGKSHISRKITKVDIAEGDHVNTLGPSVLQTENCKLIDSPGKGVPIDFKLLNSELENEMLEKTITELFITEFCVESSNIIFFVVGLLSVFEQKDIMNIKAQYPDANIIVIHNFYELETKKAIYQKIWEDIYFSFENVSAFKLPELPGIAKSEYFGYGFTSYVGDYPIRHLVLANSFKNQTQFNPDYFNLPVMSFINTIAPSKQIPNIDFVEQVIESALKRSQTYLNIGKNLPQIQLQKQSSQLKEQKKFILLPKKQMKFSLKLAYEQNMISQATNSAVTFSSSKYQPYYALSFQQNQTQGQILEMDLKIYATCICSDFKTNKIKFKYQDNVMILTGSLQPQISKHYSVDKTSRNTIPTQEFEIRTNIPKIININNDQVTLIQFNLSNVTAVQNEEENYVNLKIKAQQIQYANQDFEKQQQFIPIDFPEREEFQASKPQQCNLMSEFRSLILQYSQNTNYNQNQYMFYPSLNNQQQYNNGIISENDIQVQTQRQQIKENQNGEVYDLRFSIYEELIDNETHFVFSVAYQTEYIKNIIETKKNWKIVGLTGSYKKGKSFIAKKLLKKEEIKHGHESTTTGIQIMIDEERSTLILDTEGFERAINFYQNSIDDKGVREINSDEDKTKKMEMIKFRNIFEDIVQNFILKYSDVILIVLSDLTFTDQQLLKTCLQNAPANKQFILVHNFSRYQAITHVEKKIQQQYTENIGNIWKYFNLEKCNIIQEVIEKYTTPDQRKYGVFKNYFIEQQSDSSKNFNIYHTIIARERTEAGNYYNPAFLAFVQTQIDFVQKQLITNDSITQFKYHLNEKIQAFYKIDTKLDPHAEWEQIEQRNNQSSVVYYYMKFPKKLEKQEFAKLLREVKFYSVIEPPYFWTQQTKKDGIIIQSIVLSLPGGKKNYTDLKAVTQWESERKQNVVISGKKIKYSKQTSEQVICTNSNDGKIELKLEIATNLTIHKNVEWKEGTSLAEIQFQVLQI